VAVTQDELYATLDLELSWSEQTLPEHVRTKHVHRLHPYHGKFIPQLVEVLLGRYFRRGQHDRHRRQRRGVEVGRGDRAAVREHRAEWWQRTTKHRFDARTIARAAILVRRGGAEAPPGSGVPA